MPAFLYHRKDRYIKFYDTKTEVTSLTFKNGDFLSIFACSALAVTPSEKVQL